MSKDRFDWGPWRLERAKDLTAWRKTLARTPRPMGKLLISEALELQRQKQSA